MFNRYRLKLFAYFATIEELFNGNIRKDVPNKQFLITEFYCSYLLPAVLLGFRSKQQ